MKHVVIALTVALVISAAASLLSAGFDPSETDEQKTSLPEEIFRALVNEVLGDEAMAQVIPRTPEIPEGIYRLAGKFEGAIGLELVRKPGDADFGGSNFVARVVFEPLRPGYKACPDHYPARLVRNDEPCPRLVDGDAPASGWLSCHGAFYTHEKFGCPPQPHTPTAPATTPRPRCDFSPEICRKEAPGGPVLFRTLRAAQIAEVATPGRETEVRSRVARPDVARAAPRDVQLQPAERAAAVERAEALRTAQIAALGRLQLRKELRIDPNLLCSGGKCQWGSDDQPITLPPPPVVPFRHAPCEYEHVSFFVPENRYCPKERLGERPAAGASLYISWEEGKKTPPELYYHRDDFDGVIRQLMQILGNSDDRFAMSEATEREKAAARSTAILIKSEYVSPAGDGMVELHDDPSWPPLCSSERFAGLPQPGRCSGVKIADRLVATSAHCIRNERQCRETSVVFGYHGESASAASRIVKSDAVFQCRSIVASRRPASIGQRGADWTIFEVDRDIPAPSATLAASADVRPSIVTTVIGHPMGLPAVVTRLGVVQTTTTEYFIANSDTFVGNSGSAVFAAQSVEDNSPRVLGLLTGGGYDFEEGDDGEQCVEAKWCRESDCLGDDVVYTDDLITALSKYSPVP